MIGFSSSRGSQDRVQSKRLFSCCRFSGWRVMKKNAIGWMRLCSVAALAGLLLFAAAPTARADALSEKGLKKAGPVYAIDEDTSITKDMAALAEAKKKLAQDAKGRKKIEGNIQEPKSFIGNA